MALKGKIYSIARQHDDLNTDELFQSMMIESTDKDTIVMDGRNIAAGSIFAEQIHAGAITADHIKSGAIETGHMDAGTIDVSVLKGSQLILPGENYKGVIINNEGLSMKSTGLDVTLSSSSGFNITDKHGNPLIDIDPSTGNVKMQVNQMSIGGYSAATTEDIDDIEVGGRNLILNSRFVSTSPNASGLGSSTLMTDETKPYYRIIGDDTISTYSFDSSATSSRFSEPMIDGATYTVSVDVRAPRTGSVGFYSNIGSQSLLRANEWVRIKFTYTYNGTNYRVIGLTYDSPIIDYRNWKIEKGNKTTDWTPAPEDVQSEIDSRPTFNDFDQIDKVTINGGNIRANTIKSTHIETNTATIDKIFADTAMINHLASKTAFIDSIKAIEIDAGKISSGTISTERLDSAEIVTNGLTADVIESTHLETSTATIDKLFADDATINTLTAKTAFIDSIKAVEIDADKITTGEMHGDRIQADTLSADKITGKIPGGKITLDGDVIVDGTFKVGNTNINSGISADKITVGTMDGERITTGTLHGDTITTGTLHGDKIITNSINGDRIIGNTISANKIDAETLSAITANLGTVTAGTLKSADGTTYFNLDSGLLLTVSHALSTQTIISNGYIEQRSDLSGNNDRYKGATTIDKNGISLFYHDSHMGAVPSSLSRWEKSVISQNEEKLSIRAPGGITFGQDVVDGLGTSFYGTISFMHEPYFANGMNAQGIIRTTGAISADGNVAAGGNVSADRNVAAGGNVAADGNVFVGGILTVGGTNVMTRLNTISDTANSAITVANNASSAVSNKADKAASTNGYIIMDDGTLINWHSGFTLTRDDSTRLSGTWAWPVDFKGNPTVVATREHLISSSVVNTSSIGTSRATNSVQVRLFSNSGESFPVNTTARVRIIAIGRWK